MAAKLLSLLLAFLALGQGTVDAYVEQMNLGGYLYLVNRDHTLPSDYVPPDLIHPQVRTTDNEITMREEAAHALEAMFAAAKEEQGLTLVAVSGYRSYGRQASIFQRKVNSVGKKKALLLVAPPGASEHQLGLAMDLGTKKDTSLSEAFFDTPEGKWLAENCCRFGFIIRYKKEWTEITGYAYEPWHVRYVGKEHAQRIYEMNVPLETYIAQLREAQFALVSGEEKPL